MKFNTHIVVLAVLVMCVCGVAKAIACDGLMQPEKSDAATVPGLPVLKSVKVVGGDPEHVGTVARGALARRRIEFQNITEKTITLAIVQKSCGCINAVFDSAAVLPGEKTSLLISVAAAPGADDWIHQVFFRAEWKDGDREYSEMGRCVIRYRCDVPFLIFPEVAGVLGVSGDTATTDFYIRYFSNDEGVPEIGTTLMTIPGWTVEKLTGANEDTRILHYRASGKLKSAGSVDGFVLWNAPNIDEAMVRTPIRITAMPRVRCQPKGAMFIGQKNGETRRQSLNLVKAPGVECTPTRIRLSAASPGISADIEADGTIVVRRDMTAESTAVGTVRAYILADDGSIVSDFPIIWYSDAENNSSSNTVFK